MRGQRSKRSRGTHGTCDVSVVTARAFGSRSEDADLAVRPLREEIGDAFEGDLGSAVDPVDAGQRDAKPHHRSGSLQRL